MSGPDQHAFTAGYDEDRDTAGSHRPGYAEAFRALAGTDLENLCRAVAQQLERRGVSFGAEAFVVDPVPRLISATEWDPLAEGLAQRARALNRFLLDAYGERQIVQSGVVPAQVIEEAKGYETDLVGRLPEHGSPATVIGFDVVRDPGGEFLVLEDNLRTPSGFAYALAARAALTDALPPGFPEPRPVDPIAYELLEGVMRGAAPRPCDDPSVVVLTDGPANVAYYEHAQAARRLGAALATPADLRRDDDGLHVRLGSGKTRPVDVVYRRTNEDRVRDENGELTEVAQALLAPWLDGQIGLVNAFGNGLADDKLVHSCVEDCIRFYLDEEPLVRSVPTSTVSAPAERRLTIGELRELVIKPRHGSGGTGVVIGAHAATDDLDRLARELEAHPERYVTQPIVALSRHPTVCDGRLEPRHIDLRAFAFSGDGMQLMPGGLTRVALDACTLVVNSSQHGGGKDTWVLD
ncbi:MAG: hypothetical protein QOI48_231 [Solirubrobacteraceae bacterium]|jgi:uncharacterized circularly permuted ATP-grasp superfamily protein|nr:hypothetical protein [Solirubrobacteraceae bacterium]